MTGHVNLSKELNKPREDMELEEEENDIVYSDNEESVENEITQSNETIKGLFDLLIQQLEKNRQTQEEQGKKILKELHTIAESIIGSKNEKNMESQSNDNCNEEASVVSL